MLDIKPFIKRITQQIVNGRKQAITETTVQKDGKEFIVIIYEVKSSSIGTSFYEQIYNAEISYSNNTFLRLEKDTIDNRILFGFFIPAEDD